MSPKKILQRVRDLGTIDPRTLAKIEKHIDDPTKKVSAKAIVRYLIDNEQISQSQAGLLLESDSEYGARATHEGGRKRKPAGEAYDTDDLVGGVEVLPANPAPPPRKLPTRERKRHRDRGETASGIEPDAKQDFDVVNDPLRVDSTQLSDMNYKSMLVDFGEAPGTPKKETPSFEGKIIVGNQWESRWLFLGAGLVMFLVMTTIGLAWLLNRTTADQAKRKAQEHFDKEEFEGAKEEWQRYIRDFPQDKDVPNARAKIVNCTLRVFYNAKNFNEVLATARKELPELVKREDNQITEIQGELAVILPNTALHFSEEALKADSTEDKERLLQLATDTEELVRNSAYVPVGHLRGDGFAAQKMGEYQKNVEKVRFDIERENAYQRVLVQMKAQTESRETDAAAQAYYELILKYPLLRARQPLADAIKAVSEKERELIQPNSVELAVSNEARPLKTLAHTTLANSVGNDIPDLDGKYITYLVNGMLYGLDAKHGRIHWWREIGVETRIAPQWVDKPYSSDLIVSDQTRNEICRIRCEDGSLVWRIDVHEPFVKPAVATSRDKLFVTTRSGRVIRCSLSDGKTDMACQLPQAVTVGPVTSQDNALLYQIGMHSNLYLISQQDMTCTEVFFIGHQPNSIDVEPFLLVGNLCVLENFGQHCRAHVLGFKEHGAGVFLAQQPFKVTDGKVTLEPQRYGRRVLLASDSGDMQMYELNIDSNGDQTVVSLDSLIKSPFETHPGMANYLAISGGDLFLGNRGLTKYKILLSEQKLEIRKTANSADTFVGPIYSFENVAIHLRRRFHSLQVTAAAVNTDTLEELWQTDFGAPPVEPPFLVNNQVCVVSNQGDLFQLGDHAFEQVAIEPLVRGTNVSQNLKFSVGVDLANGNRVYCDVGDTDRILTYQPNDLQNNKLSLVEPPANQVAADPVGFNDSLLVPTDSGQICRINPLTGAMVGSPFQPPIDPNHPPKWVSPVPLDQGQFVAATAAGKLYIVKAEGDRSLVKSKELEYSANVTAPLLAIGDTVYTVCHNATNDLLVAFSTQPELAEKKSQILASEYTGGFQIVNSLIFIQTADGKINCFDADLNRKWQIDLPQTADGLVGKPAGKLALVDGAVLIAFESGDVVRLNPESGEVLARTNLELPLAGPPVVLDGKWYIGDQNGTIYLMSPLQ